MIMAQYEFLPLCDVLFNIISLAVYFSDVVFDVLMGYALYVNGKTEWFVVTMCFVLLSSAVQQIISFKWYLYALRIRKEGKPDDGERNLCDGTLLDQISVCLVLAAHVAQCGTLWRYFKLLVPVDLRFVKYEVRDLCMLRMIHAFAQSMPLLLTQIYVYWENYTNEFVDLNAVAGVLSLVSVCWALASFNKNVRIQNVHKLVLTWLGVLFQFFWRLGTVGARAISLVAYATLFKYWIFLVILLHWISMLLWILSPKNVFHGERLSCAKKALFYTVIAFVYTFAYINLIEVNHREKMLMFYLVMGLENAMLMFVWVVGVSDRPPWYRTLLPLLVVLLFGMGVAFMALYYRYFHVRRLRYEAGGRCESLASPSQPLETNAPHVQPQESLERCGSVNGRAPETYTRMRNEVYVAEGRAASAPSAIPGVFNCRFANPYAAQKRKRKKPTTFVPPPAAPEPVPFWCRPLPSQCSQQACYSENDCSSVGSRPDIQLKLQEKRMKQMAELQAIEEEMRQGKLHRRPANDFVEAATSPSPQPPPLPPPHDKKSPHYENPEILLAPRYLSAASGDENHYYDWTTTRDTSPVYRLLDEESLALMYKTYRASSDLDSQLSLPRSYTLPREFKYYRRTRPRKPVRTEHFVPSTNSSDGDVDSGDDSDSTSSHTTAQPQPLKFPPNSILKVRHETKL